jgi:hypothetical protein
MIPPRPDVEAPDPNINDPLFPLLAEPLLKISNPEMPLAPAFRDRIDTAPLLDPVPSPLAIIMRPPVFTVLRPEYSSSDPPTPLVPLPTVMKKFPPLPALAKPEPKTILPLLPLLELPELKTRFPLTPVEPALVVRMYIPPLLDSEPSPDTKRRTPPVFSKLRPAWS